MDLDYGNEDDRRAYHREATRKNREEWSTLGFKNLTIQLPEQYILLVRGQSICVTATHLLAKLESGDAEARQIIANRVPKYRVKHQDIEALQGDTETTDEMCRYMLTLLREARVQRVRVKEADHPAIAEHAAAYEYIIVYYLSGYYDIAMHLFRGGSSDLPLKLDITKAHETPNVL